MDVSTYVVLVAGLAFAVPHLVLGFPPLRPRLVRWLGEQRFVALFSSVAALGLAALAAALASSDGAAPGPAGWLPAGWRIGLMVPATAGLMLALAALASYPRNPAALFRTQVPTPRGIEKLSRHGFFVGFGMFAALHAACAADAATAVAFAVLAGVCAVGALAQDSKLRARYGTGWDAYARATSVLPGWALLRGRARIDADDQIGRVALRAGIATAVFVALHPIWAIAHGAVFFALLAVGGVFVSVRRWRAAARGVVQAVAGGRS